MAEREKRSTRCEGGEEVFTGNGAPVWWLRWLGGRRDPGEAGWLGVETEEELGWLWLVVLDWEGDPKEEENVGWLAAEGFEGWDNSPHF